MVWNARAKKKSQFIAPDKLFPLPQDVLVQKGIQKSTYEQMKSFLDQIKKIKEKGSLPSK